MVPNGAEDRRNIVPLCSAPEGNPGHVGCHDLYDNGVLDLLPYLTAEEQAYAVLLTGSLTGALRVISGGRESAA